MELVILSWRICSIVVTRFCWRRVIVAHFYQKDSCGNNFWRSRFLSLSSNTSCAGCAIGSLHLNDAELCAGNEGALRACPPRLDQLPEADVPQPLLGVTLRPKRRLRPTSAPPPIAAASLGGPPPGRIGRRVHRTLAGSGHVEPEPRRPRRHGPRLTGDVHAPAAPPSGAGQRPPPQHSLGAAVDRARALDAAPLRWSQ